MVDFLTQDATDSNYCIVGYQIGKTLSDFGAVSRGVCKVDETGNLSEIIERTATSKAFAKNLIKIWISRSYIVKDHQNNYKIL